MTKTDWPQTEFTKRLGISIPLLQAPMAGAATPELAAAVSKTGAVGSLAGAFMEPDELKQSIRRIRELTRRPFNVNLFVIPQPHCTIPIAYIEKLKEFERSAGFALSMELNPIPSFENQAAVLLEEEVPIFSFTFGIPPLSILKEFHRKRAVVLGTATHPAEALALQDAGVDFIVCQGKEAGGHRGTFIGNVNDGLVPTLELVQKVVEQTKKPVIAAGGIMNGHQIKEALNAGASAVQMGTAFLSTAESGIDRAYKKALFHLKNRKTVVSRAFTGKYARCIENQFINEMASFENETPSYPIAQSLTAPLRKAAAAADNPEFMFLLAGEHFRQCEALSAQELIARLTLEIQSHPG